MRASASQAECREFEPHQALHFLSPAQGHSWPWVAERASAAERMKPYLDGKVLPVDLLRENKTIEPEAQIAVAQAISNMTASQAAFLAWRKFPKYDELKKCCELIWEHFVAQSGSGVFTGSQLTLKTWRLRQHLWRGLLRSRSPAQHHL